MQLGPDHHTLIAIYHWSLNPLTSVIVLNISDYLYGHHQAQFTCLLKYIIFFHDKPGIYYWLSKCPCLSIYQRLSIGICVVYVQWLQWV